MWLVVLKDLKAYIMAKEPDMSLLVGADGKKPTNFPAIYFIRGKETDVDFHQSSKGNCVIVVEIWEKAVSPDPLVAYEKLAAAEETFCKHLANWSKEMYARNGFAANVTISSFRGDGEANRPMCASQAFIRIKWQRSNK